MESINNQIYKYAKYLDKYTKTSNKKGSVYLQKLDKYLHKVQHGGDVSELVEKIQSIVEQVIIKNDASRQHLDKVVAEVKKIIGEKHPLEIVLDKNDTAFTILKKTQPFIDRYNTLRTQILPIQEYEVMGYIVDPNTGTILQDVKDSKYVFPSIKINDQKSVLKEEYRSLILKALDIRQTLVNINESYKVTEAGFILVLNRFMNVFDFKGKINHKMTIITLPIIDDSTNQVSVRLFIKPKTFKSDNGNLDANHTLINDIATIIDAEIQRQLIPKEE
jgi:hypothetical protein